MYLQAGERRIAPALAGPGYWLFALPDRPVRLVCETFRPVDLGLSGDSRRLGVALTRLRVLQTDETIEIPLAALGDGCHGVEPEGWRWTDGDAALPVSAGGGTLLVEGFGAPGTVVAGGPVLFLPGDSHPADAHVPARLFAALHPVFADWRGPAPKPPPIVAARLAVLLARPPEGAGLVLVGRSSGARVATGFAAARPEAVRAVIVLGYPFFRQGALPEPSRFAHLAKLAAPTLIVQGRQDPYGGEAVRGLVQFSAAVRLRFIDADHELRLPDAGWEAVARQVLLFMAQPSVPSQASAP